MKKIFALVLFGLIGMVTYAQAEMTFEESTIDYGTIKKGSAGLRVFKFINTGDEPLVISNVRSTWGCTVPKRPTEPVLPGETGEIEVKYNSMLVDRIRGRHAVYPNAADQLPPLQIKGQVTEYQDKNNLATTTTWALALVVFYFSLYSITVNFVLVCVLLHAHIHEKLALLITF